MISQFNQPRGSTSIEVNKQSIARNFGVKEDEVIYFTAGIDLSGFKVIYDESTQRAYSLPSGIVSGTTAISLNEQAILTHSAGSVDLGELAVSREEYVTLPGSFKTGVTVNTKNELVVFTDGKYRWGGELPKTVPSGSTPETSGGIGLGAWNSVGDASLRSELISEKGSMLIGNSEIIFDNLNSALNFTSFELGKQVMIKGYNSPGDGGESFFVVVPYTETVGIPTTDSAFKLKRTSGHDYLLRMLRNGKTPRIVAHRGWHGVTPNEYSGALTSSVYFVPENTRASIAFAAERGLLG